MGGDAVATRPSRTVAARRRRALHKVGASVRRRVIGAIGRAA